MKTLKLFLDQEEEPDFNIGLIRLIKPIPDYEFFFHVNRQNPFYFSRIEDIIIEDKYYDYHFPRYKAYSKEIKTNIYIISNKSSERVQKTTITELLFDDETLFLMGKYPDVDYITKTSNSIHDFSLLLLPENLAFKIQEFLLSSYEELYKIIQYYE